MKTSALLVIAPIVKGLIMAFMLAVLEVPFVQALIIAIVSAVLTGIFLMVSTIITVRETRATQSLTRDVKRAVGATKRSTDVEGRKRRHDDTP